MKTSAVLGALACCATFLAGPLRAETVCQYVQVAKLPLRYLGPALEITVEGIINGKRADMLVDTGAYGNVLTRTGAKRQGLKLRLTGDEAEGVGGVSSIYRVWLNEFSIGPAKSTKGYAQVLGDTGDTPAYDAIAGAPFLLQLDMELALADKELKLYQPQNCDSAFLAYWDAKAVVVPFRRGYESPNPHFRVEVNGKRLDAIIDSGAGISSITADVARKLGLPTSPSDGGPAQYTAGIGAGLARTWIAHTQSIKIGTETVLDADIAVIDPQTAAGFDIVLGADFLRAHRVLFAMSQNKLYLSYLGGDVFAQRQAIEPWMRKEADGGNADAQMTLARRYLLGLGVPKDEPQGQAWLDKAAASGHVDANLFDGYRQLNARRYAEAASRLSTALGKLDDGRHHALALYQTRVGSGQQALGAQELAARFGRFDRQVWPGPVAEYYLGHIDRAGLQAQALADARFARERNCEALEYMVELYRAQGDTALADPVQADWDKTCAPERDKE